jgi:CheY-like chemotaxis protein
VESESLSPQPNLHILIVEDNVFNQKVAIGLLKQRGHSVTVANDGEEALDLTRDSLFDAVLMDLQMPGKDGLETTRALRLREQGSGQRLHIIGLTAHAMGGDRQRCLDAGMDDYVTKPIRVQVLDQALAAVRVSTAPAPPEPPAPAPEGG